MNVSHCVRCATFPCTDVQHAGYVVPNLDVRPERIAIILISAPAPPAPIANFILEIAFMTPPVSFFGINTQRQTIQPATFRQQEQLRRGLDCIAGLIKPATNYARYGLFARRRESSFLLGPRLRGDDKFDCRVNIARVPV